RHAPAGTDANMEIHLDIEDRLQSGMGLAHLVERAALVDGQRIGPREVDQEKVVLGEVVAKGRFREASVAKAFNEAVSNVAPPRRTGIAAKTLEEIGCGRQGGASACLGLEGSGI